MPLNSVIRSDHILVSRTLGFWLIVLSLFLLVGSPWLVDKAATNALQNRLERSAMGFAQELSTELEIAENRFVRAVSGTRHAQLDFEKIASRWLADSEPVLAVRLLNGSGQVVHSMHNHSGDSPLPAQALPVHRITLIHAMELLTPSYSALYAFQGRQLVDLFIPVDAPDALAFVLTIDTGHWSKSTTAQKFKEIAMRVVPYNDMLKPESFNHHVLALPAWEGLWALQFESLDPMHVLLAALRPASVLVVVLILGSFYFHWRGFRIRQKTEAELLEKSQLLEKQNRLSMLGEMSASLAHEINQPLASIANYAVAGQLKLQQTDPAHALLPLLEKIQSQSQRAAQVLMAVRAMLHPTPMDSAIWNTGPLLEKLAPHLSRMCTEHQVVLNMKLTGASDVNLNPILFEQVLINLVKNSIQAHETSGIKDKQITLTSAAANGRLHIEVADNGPGILLQDVPRIFDSFFTTKKEGLGIGLKLCRSVIERFNGQLLLKSNSPEGVCFLIDLPVASTVTGVTSP